MPRTDPARRCRTLRTLPRRDRILVVSGGRTEISYLYGLLREQHRPPAVTVRFRALDPAGLVAYAARLAADHAVDADQIWCVVDVDEFDIESARALAARYGVELVVSNPCFEVWLLLHHQDCTAHLPHCGAAIRLLRKHIDGYAKGDLDFARFADGVPAAVKRAKALPAGRNPSTGVWRLVARMVA